ncbi:agamous-like MADS-box protein AGL62 [Manihot esculenta]|uniref:MADS-box domain-containing protein n=1 Tax=Manihot esculenta TaxID=3983 RepID=A0A2C9VIS1_MANES|nr:agamous-like MADS-box protein AGL62 [Manihot esculenta]OAY45333.1 hypothetical protein MANES_07G051700v8 [Manihot esculenta]
MARKSKGRQKVAMVKMPNESNLQVTFSKRRSGLFKKASELCTLCGVEVAIIVFSPGKKVFSFGHPGVETVVERFITRSPPQISPTMQLIEAHRNASVRELNLQLTQVCNQLEMEKKKAEEINQTRKANKSQCWWESPIEELNMPQLQQLKLSLEQLKKIVATQADKLLIQNSQAHLHSQFYASTSSGAVLPFESKNGVFNPEIVPSHGHNLGYGRGFY